MNTFKCWASVLIAILMLPNVAVSADAAKEAYEKGKAFLEKQDYDAAIAAFAEGSPRHSPSPKQNPDAQCNSPEEADSIGREMCPEIGQERNVLCRWNSEGQGTDQLHPTGPRRQVSSNPG
jgi:hypothetical protein